ncbi:MAG: hypothetical protein ACRDIB_02915 [Ardenticatenaceae bacterium]
MAIDAGQMRRILVRKLRCEECEGTRHECYAVVVEGQLVAKTYLSRGKRTLGDPLLRWMAGQLGVSLQAFKRFCACDIEREAFTALILRGRS